MAKTKKNEEKRPLVDLPNNAYKNKSELEAGMEYMGEQMLEKERLVNEANQKISQIRSELEETIYPIQAKIDHVTSGIAYFVQKNREELFPDPNLKTCKLISGRSESENLQTHFGNVEFSKDPCFGKNESLCKTLREDPCRERSSTVIQRLDCKAF
ncbi:Gam-like protein [Leptospira alstonii serovar Pingchang str. 80-412]|uniref:Gam-like protein n=1 Tax=Leptospira alstonii serovar Pingchang str. 80-412 TaxID=1218564 RepID=T0G3T9_9LEPT|nr:Gam-like protein [Leptospira alstonii serovar Pingchang str. 80-412]